MDYQPMSDIPPSGVDARHVYRRFIAGFVGLQAVGGTMSLLLGIWLNSYGGTTGFGWDSSTIFKFHPLFMTTGIVFLNGKAMLMYRILRNRPKMMAKIIHGCVNLLSIVFTIIALVAVIKHKNDAGYSHFYSVHSWVGIGAIALFLFQWVIGFLVFLYPGGGPTMRAVTLKLHRFFGALIFILACVSVLTGVVTVAGGIDNYNQLPWSGRVLNAFSMSLILYGIGVFMLLSVEEFRRPPG